MNINSLDDYQANLAQIEKARRVLDTYQAMNEDAKSKYEYQQELARKIAEGDRARQELELFKRRDALAITTSSAPLPPPQATPPSPVYVQTTARIEEVPTHVEQRNVHSPYVQSYWNVQRQEPTQQHNFYTGSMPQRTRDSAFRYYYPEQQNGNQQVYRTDQSTAQHQSSPAWSTYVRQLSQPHQQQRPQLPTQALGPNSHTATQEVRPQTQRTAAPHRDHPQPGAITPMSNPNAYSQPQLNNASSMRSISANSSSLAAALEPMSSSTQVPNTHETIRIGPEARPQIQRMTEPHQDHAVAPVSNPVTFSKHQPNNSSLSAFANPSGSVAVPKPGSSTMQNVSYTHETINKRPTVPEVRPQMQQMIDPPRDHSRQGVVTPVSNSVTSSKHQPNNTSNTPPYVHANSSNSVAAPEPVSSSALETQKSVLTNKPLPTQSQAPKATPTLSLPTQSQPPTATPTLSLPTKSQAPTVTPTLPKQSQAPTVTPTLSLPTQSQPPTATSTLSLPTQSQPPTVTPTLYKATSDVHLHGFTSNLDVIRYVTASYATWVNDMPPNSYFPVPNTTYYIWKRRDNVIYFVYPTAEREYVYLDIQNLIPQYALTTRSSKGENIQSTTTNQAKSLSNISQMQPAQGTTIISIPPSNTGANTQATRTPVLTVKSNLPMQPQQRPVTDSLLNKPKRTPGDADKRTLARDIIRALGLKRPRPTESPATETVERPTKRRVQEPSASSPTGASGTVISNIGNPSSMSVHLPTASLPAPTTSMEVPAVRSSTLDLPPAPISEPEPKQSIEGVVSSTKEEVPLSGAAQSSIMDVDETTDDAAHSLNRLTIQEQVVVPSAEGEQAPPAQTEEIGGSKIQVLGEATKEDKEKDFEEGEIQVPSEATKEDKDKDVEEGEIQVPGEATKEDKEKDVEEGEIQVPGEASKIDEERNVEDGEIRAPSEEVEDGEIRMARLPEGGKTPSIPILSIGENVTGDAKPVVKTPLFLPSPSPSPRGAGSAEGSRQSSAHPPVDSSILNGDSSMTNSLHGVAVLRRQQHKSRNERSSRKRGFYILVPSLPSYVRKYKKQEARRKKRQKLLAQVYGGKARSSSEDNTSDPHVQLTIRNSVTRIAERRCKWGGCDAILNSSQNLFEHLKRSHSTPDPSKPYILCSWSSCGDHVRNEDIEEHLSSHSFSSFLCPYAECDESFRSVRALVRHSDGEHASDKLKSASEPFSPHVQEPPPIPRKVPDYLIKSGLVRQEPIPRDRHAVLGPWVYNNIAGPVHVTKRYNAAKNKPAEYGFLQSSSMQFSTNPSQPAKMRDLGDLPSGEVSEMISEGFYLWPPQQTSSEAVANSEDELDGFRAISNLAVVPIKDKSPVTSEDTVETVLTGQPYDS